MAAVKNPKPKFLGFIRQNRAEVAMLRVEALQKPLYPT